MFSSAKCTAFVLLVAVLSTAAPARAQETAPAPDPSSPTIKPWGPRLEYSGAPGCPNEESFRDKVATFFKGVDPFDPNARNVLRVALKKITGGYRASVQYTPPDGDPWPAEDMTGAPCADVVAAAARLARMRGMDKPKEPPPPVPASPPDPTPAESPHLPPDPVASQAPRVAPASIAPLRSTPPPKPTPPMDLTISLSTALLMTAGFTADVGPALQLGAGVRRDWFSVDLELRGVFPGRAWASVAIDPSKPTNPRPFDLSQLSAQLVPCARFATYFAGCGVVGAYTLITQDPTTTNFFPGWMLGPRFGVEVPFAERFAVFGFAEALFAPLGARQRYPFPSAPDRNDAPNVQWDLSIVSGFFGFGALVKFQ